MLCNSDIFIIVFVAAGRVECLHVDGVKCILPAYAHPHSLLIYGFLFCALRCLFFNHGRPYRSCLHRAPMSWRYAPSVLRRVCVFVAKVGCTREVSTSLESPLAIPFNCLQRTMVSSGRARVNVRARPCVSVLSVHARARACTDRPMSVHPLSARQRPGYS